MSDNESSVKLGVSERGEQPQSVPSTVRRANQGKCSTYPDLLELIPKLWSTCLLPGKYTRVVEPGAPPIVALQLVGEQSRSGSGLPPLRVALAKRPVLRGRHVLQLPEHAGEIRQVAEARFEANLGDTNGWVLQAALGQPHPGLDDVVDGRQAELLLESAEEIGLAHVRLRAQLLDANFLGQVLFDVMQRVGKAIGSGQHSRIVFG